MAISGTPLIDDLLTAPYRIWRGFRSSGQPVLYRTAGAAPGSGLSTMRNAKSLPPTTRNDQVPRAAPALLPGRKPLPSSALSASPKPASAHRSGRCPAAKQAHTAAGVRNRDGGEASVSVSNGGARCGNTPAAFCLLSRPPVSTHMVEGTGKKNGGSSSFLAAARRGGSSPR